MVASITDPKIVKPQHSKPVLAEDHKEYERGSYTSNRLYKENSTARLINQKKEKEKEESVESNITEAKRKREDLSLLGDEEGKPKVNRFFGQRIIRNTVKLAKHNSQSTQ
ncbi:25010_t:CDS:2 [Dentiscutata erythropus]|uniref:25010_t:CDS:1 n=1 Tax=Dentiscutata erythropus TaxID=1348616 RepID=A0A9N9H5I4_9GLOM|nr:25010_t:CDS:2 [Dentiscutata erythropus]